MAFQGRKSSYNPSGAAPALLDCMTASLKRRVLSSLQEYHVPGTLLRQEDAVPGRETRHFPGMRAVLPELGHRSHDVWMAQPWQCRTQVKESNISSRSHHQWTWDWGERHSQSCLGLTQKPLGKEHTVAGPTAGWGGGGGGRADSERQWPASTGSASLVNAWDPLSGCCQ